MTIPPGFCQCGCGERTTVARQNSTRSGWVKGEPIRWRKGHNARRDTLPLDRYKVDPETGCWVWQRSLNTHGYAQIRWHGRAFVVHRLMYEKFRGPLPEGLELDHLCRNRACVNPWHLEAVTHVENNRRGASTKLTIEQVREIKSLFGRETQAEIARRFGVTRENIHAIYKGKSWVIEGEV